MIIPEPYLVHISHFFISLALVTVAGTLYVGIILGVGKIRDHLNR